MWLVQACLLPHSLPVPRDGGAHRGGVYAWVEGPLRDPSKDLLDEMVWDDLWPLGFGLHAS